MTPGGWTSVRVRSPSNRAAVANALFALGAEGIHELDDDLVTHIRDIDRSHAGTILQRADATASVEFSPTPTVDWSSEWRSRITSHRVGSLVVTPPWLAQQFTERERITIDPGMAFGTGDHETTRGVLRLMQRVVGIGELVADLGAGSAVLAIGAAKLGARRVVAVEIDPDAIGNAEENIRANQVSGVVTIIEGDAASLLPLIAPVQVVLANIISSVLLELLPIVRGALDERGMAILSGILKAEQSEMESAFREGGWRIVDSDEEGMWWSVTIAPR